MDNTTETTEQKVIDELHGVKHKLAEAVALEHRAEADITKAERHIEKIEEELAHESYIVVNGRQRTIEGREVSYEDAVKLAYPDGPARSDVRYTVTFRNAVGPERSGELDAGQSVTVMVVRICAKTLLFYYAPNGSNSLAVLSRYS